LTVVSRRPAAEAYNTLGVLYAEENHLSCAVAAFEQALSLDNRDWRARSNLASALVKAGAEKRAVEQLRILIQQKPDLAAAHNVLGTLLRSEGKVEPATEEFKAALRTEPGLAPAALNLGEILITRKRYLAAIACLQDALKFRPPAALDEQLRVTLEVAQAENGDSDLAIETLEQAIKSYPLAADAYFNLATVYAKKGPAVGYGKAVDNFQNALRIDPHYDEARYSLAKVLVQFGRFSEAIPYLNDYTHRQPRDPEGFHLLGSAYSGLSQVDKAVEFLQQAKRLKPGDGEIHYDLGIALAKSGRTSDGIQQLEFASRVNPGSPETHYQLALQYRKQGDLTRSKQEMQVFQELKGQENAKTAAGNLNNEASRLLQEGKAEEAVEAYRKAVQLDPGDAHWRYNLSLALAKLGDRKAQKEVLTKVLELDPDMANAHNDLGLAHLSEGKMREAEAEFHAALDINPRFAEALDNLGIVYRQQGRDSEARALFRQAAANDPNYAKAFIDLGLLMAEQGDLSGAEQQIQQALKVSPNDIRALTVLGMIEGKMGQRQESVQAFRKVVALNTESAEAHLNLGIALADQYDLQGALGEFSEAIRLDPNYAAAYYNKGRVLYDLNRRLEALPLLDTACKLQPRYGVALYLLAVVWGPLPAPRKSWKISWPSTPKTLRPIPCWPRPCCERGTPRRPSRTGEPPSNSTRRIPPPYTTWLAPSRKEVIRKLRYTPTASRISKRPGSYLIRYKPSITLPWRPPTHTTGRRLWNNSRSQSWLVDSANSFRSYIVIWD
jgi:tetratricopeptide (TPR) repeat protein